MPYTENNYTQYVHADGSHRLVFLADYPTTSDIGKDRKKKVDTYANGVPGVDVYTELTDGTAINPRPKLP